mgnify:FL=1
MKKKLLLLAVSLIAIMLVFAGCGGNDDPQTEGQTEVWKLAHQESTGTVFDNYAHHFADLVSEKSNGRITVEVYPVGQLGDTGTQVEMLMNGGVQFGILAAGDVGDMFPATQALSLNFVFSDDDDVNSAVLTQGEATKYLNNLFLDKNITTYDWLSLGNMQWTSNKPLHTLKDFKGFKMRIMASPIIAANYEALGASPTPMAFTETYSGLQLKTVEGTEQPLNAIQEMKFYEVQDYITMSNHAQMASFMAMNSDFYNGLSDEDKALLDEIKPEMESFAKENLQQMLTEKFDAIKEAKPGIKVEELTEEERQAFIDASLPVRDRIEEFGGKEAKKVLDLLLADVEKYEKER